MRTPNLSQAMFATLLAALMTVTAAAAEPEKTPLPPAAADHHLHIQGPDVAAELQKMAARAPEHFKGIDPGLLQVHTGADALRVLDEAGIKQGVLLSQGYTFGSPFAAADKPDVVVLTRRENRYVVTAALASGDRLKAFIGIDPLAANALDELKYWAHRPGVTGVKMHLGNCGFDSRSATDIEKMVRVFDAIREAGLPMVIHAQTAGSYGADDARRFIEKVLPHAGDSVVQIAHAAGGGGLDEPTLAALSVYEDAIARHAPGTKRLIFDLAVVLVDEHADPSLDKRLAETMRGIGLERFVVGSDWPSLFAPKKHNEVLEMQIPLTGEEWRIVLANRAPYLR